MIILDTNVLSALMKPSGQEKVLHWVDTVGRQEVRTTAVTVMELHYVIARMAPGRRRLVLELAFKRLKDSYLSNPLPFDEHAAAITGEILAQAHAAGRNLDYPDTQIAGIAIANGAILATRNIKDFAGLGIELVNPWD